MIQIDQEKLNQWQKEKQIKDLKKLLSDSDFRMTTDYFSQMTEEDQDHWTLKRSSWRTELRALEGATQL